MIKFEKPPIRLRYLLLAAVLFLTIYMLESYVQAIVRGWNFNFQFNLFYQLLDQGLWVLFSYLIYSNSHNYLLNFKKVSLIQHIYQGITSFIIGLLQITLVNVLNNAIWWTIGDMPFQPFSGHSLSSIFINTISVFVVYWFIAGVFFAVDYYKRFNKQQIKLTEMQNELNNAQLSALRMQLNPHFLFNTLHTISSLMGKNDQGQKVLSRLGHLLRSMLEQDQEHTVLLEQEIEYLKNYLYIEEVRFQDRLEVIFEISDETLECNVPNLILQPLVENAIKHGFSKRMDSGSIIIRAYKSLGKLVLEVEDDGKGAENIESLLGSSRIGLKNTQQRLNKMYTDSSFKIESELNKGFKVKIKIPCN